MANSDSVTSTIWKLDIPPHRIFGLDLLRAIAILLVVFRHTGWIVPVRYQRYYNIIDVDGVSIFFVLSGFLIGSIIIKFFNKKHVSFKELLIFWNRRWLRTLPLYFIILLLCMLLYPAFGFEVPFDRIPGYLTFTQNFDTPHPDFLGVAWSLSVEEWFYLLFPFLTLIISRSIPGKPIQIILLLSIAICTLSPLYRFYHANIIPVATQVEWSKFIRMEVLTRFDAIQFGVLGAYVSLVHTESWSKYKIPCFLLGIALLFATSFLKLVPNIDYSSWYYAGFSLSLEPIGTLMLLPFLSTYHRKSDLFYKATTVLSIISYSLYLIHVSIVGHLLIYNHDWYSIIPIPNLNIVVKYAAYWLLSIILSVASYRFIELPILRFRDRKFQRQAIPTSATAEKDVSSSHVRPDVS